MNILDFLQIHNEKKQELEVFEVLDSDDRITNETVAFVEYDVKCKLPKNYIDFCIALGGGYFGFTIIHSMDKKSQWYIGEVLHKFSYYLPNGYLPFSDDQVGGFYCFKIVNNVATDSEIFYIDSSGKIDETHYKSFFEYVIDKAYSF